MNIFPLWPQPYAQQWVPTLLGHRSEVICEACKRLHRTWALERNSPKISMHAKLMQLYFMSMSFKNSESIHAACIACILTNLEVWVDGQSFIHKPVPAWVPRFEIHDVTLCFLICQRYRGELKDRERGYTKVRDWQWLFVELRESKVFLCQCLGLQAVDL